MTAPIRRDVLQDLDQFRSQVRQWLEDNCPESQRQPMTAEDQYYGGRNAHLSQCRCATLVRADAGQGLDLS